MKRLAGIAVLLAAAGLALAADDPNAPLANAKQELKQLQRDEAAKRTGAADEKLKGAMPSLNTPMPGQSELDLTSSLKASREEAARKQQSAQKNWLLDGYDGLDAKGKNARTKGDGRKAGTPDGKDDLIDPRDPDYVRKTYARQSKNADDEKNRTGNSRKPGSPAGADPFAPFLKGWLANSPVRNAALDTAGRRDTPGLPNGADETFLTVDARSGATTTTGVVQPEEIGHAQDATAVNPFLQALVLPPAMRDGPANASQRTAAPPPVLAAPKASLTTPADTPAPSRNDLHKPPPSQRDDDKKYFPQLKRF
ncbi:MAG: hypothetical protein HYV95_01440 [Opitutae bacterium]|nr:hypothetical protein [Opitutae bacterium]